MPDRVRPDVKRLMVEVPPEWMRALKQYALDHDVLLKDIGVEALREWAAKRKVSLSGAARGARESRSDAEGDQRDLLVGYAS